MASLSKSGQAASGTSAAFTVTPIRGRTTLRLRSWRSDLSSELATGSAPTAASAIAAAPMRIADQPLPNRVGATAAGAMRVLCTGPGDWLITSQAHSAASLRVHLEPGLSEQGLVLVDLTDGLAVFETRGAAARDVLSKGCGLDFHPRSFPPGRCARTRFAQVPVVIDYLEESSCFELYVPRSYGSYLHAWLSDAAIEFTEAST